MKRVFGLVGYACNGKSTIINHIIENRSDYKLVNLPIIYKDEATKNGYKGITEWYTAVGLSEYRKKSLKAVISYLEKEISRTDNIIIDDIFDIKVFDYLIKVFPQMTLISFHSKHQDRLERLSKRANLEGNMINIGLKARDEMKKFCGIERIFPFCKYNITNSGSIDNVIDNLNNELNKNYIINIVGYSGSGKSTINNLLSRQINAPIFLYGKEVKKIINKKGYKKSRDYIKKYGIDKYTSLMNSSIIKCINQFMKNNKLFLIDGLVSNDIFEYLAKNTELISIYINTSEKERIKRLMKRENLEEKEAYKELDRKDSIKIECGLDIIASKCNYVVNGNHNLSLVIDDINRIIFNRIN